MANSCHSEQVQGFLVGSGMLHWARGVIKANASTHMQDELGSHGLVVTDCVFHVAAVTVLGHLQPVALPS